MLTHEFEPMNAQVLCRVPKLPPKPITLSPELEMEIAQELFFMVVAVAPEVGERVKPGDGVYFAEAVDPERDFVPVKWENKEEMEAFEQKKQDEQDPSKATERRIGPVVQEENDGIYNMCTKHVSRILGKRSNMYKDEINN
jgi:hypothetical protein